MKSSSKFGSVSRLEAAAGGALARALAIVVAIVIAIVMAVPMALLPAMPAVAAVERVSQRNELTYWVGVDGEEGRVALSRLSLASSLRLRAGEHWDIDLAGRLEGAHDRTGLGSVDSYSPASRPWIRRDQMRLELDRMVLSRRFGDSRISIGKQTVAWGVLDGVQVTDRFDPVRRRDFVLTEVRPERLARWGVRWRHDGEPFRADLAVAFDPTVNQLAQVGDRFEPRAPRLRGGLDVDLPAVELAYSERDRYVRDATFGLRLGRTVGRADASVLFLSGPDLEPLLRLDASDPARPAIIIDHPRRRLFGATLELPEGSRVWRVELAHLPDQPVNLSGPQPLDSERRGRSLAGVGMDWNAPDGWFVNAQLALDRLHGGAQAVRPRTDLIATLRAQRGFLHDTLKFRQELLSSLSDGDGVVRAALDWQAGDRLQMSVGADWLYGSRDGLFGQYRDHSQLWVQMRLSF